MSKYNSKLLFIYNADSGIANALLDYGKKYVQPAQYDCRLCAVSYGPFGMRRNWKRFISKLPYEVIFLHKDEFEQKYQHIKTSYPALVLVSNKKNTVLLDNKDFRNIHALEELKSMVVGVVPK